MEHVQNEVCIEKFKNIERELKEGSQTMKEQSDDLKKLTLAFTKVSVSFGMMTKVLWALTLLLASAIVNYVFKFI